MLYSIILFNKPTWPIFLTNWNLVIGTVYFICITAISGLYGLDSSEEKSGKEDEEQKIGMTKYGTQPRSETQATHGHSDSTVEKVIFKLLWVWYGLTYIICTVMVALYWAFVTEDFHFDTPELIFSYVNDHGINLVLILIDFCFHKIPVRIFHVVYSITVAIIYIILSVIYNFAADDPIYKVLDWDSKAGWAILYVIIAIVLAIIMQCLFYGLFRLKLYFKKD